MTIHWVDFQWVPQNLVLAFHHFPYPHNGNAYRNQLVDTLKSAGIIPKVSLTTILFLY
jgi:hypothetical protein